MQSKAEKICMMYGAHMEVLANNHSGITSDVGTTTTNLWLAVTAGHHSGVRE